MVGRKVEPLSSNLLQGWGGTAGLRCPGAGGTLGPAPNHAGVWVLEKGAELSKPHNVSEQQR